MFQSLKEASEVSENVGVVVVRGRIAGTHCHGVFQQRRRLLQALCLRLDDSQQVERLKMLCVIGEDHDAQLLGES